MNFDLDDKVRFMRERLDALTAQDRRRLEGRIGVVQGFHKGTRKPVVYFPQIQDQSDLRLFGVDPRQLEVAFDEGAQPNEPVQLSDQTVISDKLSQDETDHLFD